MPIKSLNEDIVEGQLTRGDSSLSMRQILAYLGPQNIVRIICSRLLSVNHYYVLNTRIDPQHVCIGAPRFNFTIERLQLQDLANIIENTRDLAAYERREIASRYAFFERGFSNCYAAKMGNKIMHFQWILYPTENEIIEREFCKIFTKLNKKQVMLEKSYTLPLFRGQGYLAYVSQYLLNQAAEQSYQFAVSYMMKERINSLNEFLKLGFKITKLITERKIAGMIF
jgi:hypothetical protein